MPLLFVEQQILALTIHGAFVTRSTGYDIIHSECEVYATRGIMTNVRASNCMTAAHGRTAGRGRLCDTCSG